MIANFFRSSSSGANILKTSALSLYPKFYLRMGGSVAAVYVKRLDSWSKVYNKFHKTKHWYNTEGMKDQYYCHFDIAKYKNPWNLEPSRPNVSYKKTVKYACNPR